MSQIQGKWIADGAITQSKLADGTFVFNGITSDGPIGINVNPPLDDLHIVDSTAAIRLDSTSGTGRAYQFRSDPDGNLVIRDINAAADRLSMGQFGNITSSVVINNFLEALALGVNTAPGDPIRAMGADNDYAVLSLNTGSGTDGSFSAYFSAHADSGSEFRFIQHAANEPFSVAGVPYGGIQPLKEIRAYYGGPAGPIMISNDNVGAGNLPIYLAPNTNGATVPAVTIMDDPSVPTRGIGVGTNSPAGVVDAYGIDPSDVDAQIIIHQTIGADGTRASGFVAFNNNDSDEFDFQIYGVNDVNLTAGISHSSMSTIIGQSNGPLMIQTIANNPIHIVSGSGSAIVPTVTITGNAVGIDSTAPTSTLTIMGSIALQQALNIGGMSTYTVTPTDSILYNTYYSTETVTLPIAADYPGRTLRIFNTIAHIVQSDSSNVVPMNSWSGFNPTAGTAILDATIGKWADLQSVEISSNWYWLVTANN